MAQATLDQQLIQDTRDMLRTMFSWMKVRYMGMWELTEELPLLRKLDELTLLNLREQERMVAIENEMSRRNDRLGELPHGHVFTEEDMRYFGIDAGDCMGASFE